MRASLASPFSLPFAPPVRLPCVACGVCVCCCLSLFLCFVCVWLHWQRNRTRMETLRHCLSHAHTQQQAKGRQRRQQPMLIRAGECVDAQMPSQVESQRLFARFWELACACPARRTKGREEQKKRKSRRENKGGTTTGRHTKQAQQASRMRALSSAIRSKSGKSLSLTCRCSTRSAPSIPLLSPSR